MKLDEKTRARLRELTSSGAIEGALRASDGRVFAYAAYDQGMRRRKP